MKIAFEIDNDMLPSFEQYIAAYHPAQTVTVEDFVILHVYGLIERVATAFPPPSVVADKAEIQVIQDRIKDKLKPTKEPGQPRP